MKKAISLILVLVLALGLCACGKKAEEGKSNAYPDMIAKFKVGMTPEEVLDAYGKPNTYNPSQKSDFTDDYTDAFSPEEQILHGYFRTVAGDVTLFSFFRDLHDDTTGKNKYDFMQSNYYIQGTGAFTQQELAQAKKDFDSVLSYMKGLYGEPTVNRLEGTGPETEIHYPDRQQYVFRATSPEGKTADITLTDSIEYVVTTMSEDSPLRPTLFTVIFYGWN